MGITVIWDDEDRSTIRYQFEGNWTWDDMHNAIATSNAMLDKVERRIHFIYDFSHSAGVPDGALRQLRRFVGVEHAKTGNQVVVGPQNSTIVMLAKGLVAVVKKVYRTDWGLVFTDSLEQARNVLVQAQKSRP